MQSFALPSIWSASPCTLPFSKRAPSFEKSRRFQFNSIYYKDDPHKPKNQQSILTRPQIILNEFRQKIKQATKNYQTTGNLLKKKKSNLEENPSSSINVKASEVTERLYQESNNVLLMKYDLNGNRSSFFQGSDQNEKQNLQNPGNLSPKHAKMMRKQHTSCDNVYITATPRTDFSRPLNFHPGPGSYNIAQDQSVSYTKSRMSGKSIESSHKRKYSDLTKSLLSEKSHNDQKSCKKTFESISKKYSTIDISQSPERRKNIILKKMKFFTKKE